MRQHSWEKRPCRLSHTHIDVCSVCACERTTIKDDQDDEGLVFYVTADGRSRTTTAPNCTG